MTLANKNIMKKESIKKGSFNPIMLVTILLVVSFFAGLFIGLNLPSVFSPNQNSNNKITYIRVEGVSANNSPFLGSPNAPVTIIEFSDFECVFCKSFFNSTFKEIKMNYIDSGKVKFVVRDFPLVNIHPNAENASKAAKCAYEQNKYWEFHDILFENQEKWAYGNATSEFTNYSSMLGLNKNEFTSCLTSEKYSGEILKDIQDGVNAGVEGTPTFYINGIKVVGAQTYDVFKEIIDAELKT